MLSEIVLVKIRQGASFQAQMSLTRARNTNFFWLQSTESALHLKT